ncbi:MAG: hypothetical protein V9H69_24415 [Anaerolineae bacterium]
MDGIAGIDLDPRVDDGHGLDPRGPQIGDHSPIARKGLLIPGETAEAIHVVDVQVERVQRNAAGAELGRQLAHRGLVGIAPARLVVAQRPQRRQRHAAGQLAVALQHIAQAGRGHEIVAQLAGRRLEAQRIAVAVAKIKEAAAGIVQQQAIGRAGLAGPAAEGWRLHWNQAQKEGDALVDRIVVQRIAGRIGVVQLEAPAAAGHEESLLPQAIETRAGQQALAADHRPLALHRLAPAQTLRIVGQQPAQRVMEADTAGRELHAAGQRRAAQLQRVFLDLKRRLGGRPVAARHGVGEAMVELPVRRQPHPEQLRRQQLDTHRRLPAAQLQTLAMEMVRRYVT